MEFEQNYNNPCWPESIPPLPYQNNSYLLIDGQQQLIDPVFQAQYTFSSRHILFSARISVCLSTSVVLVNDNDNKNLH